MNYNTNIYQELVKLLFVLQLAYYTTISNNYELDMAEYCELISFDYTINNRYKVNL